jgi:hypothetical protein
MPEGHRREFWKKHLEMQRSSDYTQTEYCQKYNLSRVGFSKWKKKICTDNTIASRDVNSFAAISVHPAPPIPLSDFYIEVEWRNSIRVRIREDTPIETLEKILKAVSKL